ncbi:MAG: flagellar basal body P-ring formation protein FlgA [Magnetococcales bacterium]|nr:flagellar basal body P-ring formation protein FlgA [Magnetococcales bacterium]
MMLKLRGLLAGMLLSGIAVTAQAQVIGRQEVMREAGERLRVMVEKSGKGLRMERVFYRSDLNLPDGKVDWRVTTPVGDLAPGRNQVAVEVAVNGQAPTLIQVTANLKQRIRYLTLRRPLKRGDVVTEADLKWEEVEAERNQDGMVTDMAALVGQSAIRSLQAGKPLRIDWFDTPVVVARGERVQVVMESGPLRIEAVGVARAPGRVGETIALENPDSHRRFNARVVGPGRAQAMTW